MPLFPRPLTVKRGEAAWGERFRTVSVEPLNKWEKPVKCEYRHRDAEARNGIGHPMNTKHGSLVGNARADTEPRS
jgi:hypothetical protein